jgi:hypothetical protein
MNVSWLLLTAHTYQFLQLQVIGTPWRYMCAELNQKCEFARSLTR